MPLCSILSIPLSCQKRASIRFEMTPNATGAVERDLYLKRVVDVFGAALGLALFSPVLLISGLLIRLTMGRPVFRDLGGAVAGIPLAVRQSDLVSCELVRRVKGFGHGMLC